MVTLDCKPDVVPSASLRFPRGRQDASPWGAPMVRPGQDLMEPAPCCAKLELGRIPLNHLLQIVFVVRAFLGFQAAQLAFDEGRDVAVHDGLHI